MANESIYQSIFQGAQMDERLTAVANLQEALDAVEQAIMAKYTKPASGIPETDLDEAVQSALAKARSAVQDLSNYYSKTEIDALLSAVNSQQYVDVTALPTASADTLGKIYLVGPDANNQYARYYTSYDGSAYSWVAAGTTEINLALYATKEELSQLSQEKVGYSPINKANGLTWEAGYRKTTEVVSLYGLFHAEFDIKAGDTVTATLPYAMAASIPALLKKTGANTYVNLLTFSEAYISYTYTADEDMTICANFRAGETTYDGAGFTFTSPSVYDILEENNKGNARLNVGKNLLDPSKIKAGYYLSSSGTEYANSGYCISDYIPFTGGKIVLSVDGQVFITGGAGHVLYDSEKQVVRGYTISELAGGPLSWEEDVAFVRFSIPYSSLENHEGQVELGTYPTRYIPFGDYVPPFLIEPGNNLTTRFGHLYDSGELGEGEALTLPATYVRDNLVLSAIVNGTIEEVQLGQGDGIYNGGHFSVTATNLVIGANTYPHGLTLTGRTVIIMSRAEDKKITIVSNSGGVFQQEMTGGWGGAPYIKNNGSSSLDVALTFMPKNITKKVWLIGDSYMAVAQTRWPYWVLDWAGDNVLIDNLPGGGSINMMPAFLTDLSIGQPEYALWGLGMNDGSDATASNFNAWKRYVLQFITLCLARNITPILATIPSVPSINNESKNAWVKASGFRYIDFAKAVNAQADGTWDAGLLASDNVHPTEEGAKVLASQVLIDFPEIAYE